MFQGIMLKEKRLPWVSSLGEAGDSSPWSRWWEPVSARRMGCPAGDPGSLTLPEMPLSSRSSGGARFPYWGPERATPPGRALALTLRWAECVWRSCGDRPLGGAACGLESGRWSPSPGTHSHPHVWAPAFRLRETECLGAFLYSL